MSTDTGASSSGVKYGPLGKSAMTTEDFIALYGVYNFPSGLKYPRIASFRSVLCRTIAVFAKSISWIGG